MDLAWYGNICRYGDPMAEAVLRDVVARLMLDPLFLTTARANRTRLLKALDLTTAEREALSLLLSPPSEINRMRLSGGSLTRAFDDNRLRDRLARSNAVNDLLTGSRPSISRPGSTVSAGHAGVAGALTGAGAGLQGLGTAIQRAGGQVGGEPGRTITGLGEDVSALGKSLGELGGSLLGIDPFAVLEKGTATTGQAVVLVGNLIQRLGTHTGQEPIVNAGREVSGYGRQLAGYGQAAGIFAAAIINTVVEGAIHVVGVIIEAAAEAGAAVVRALRELWNFIVGLVSGNANSGISDPNAVMVMGNSGPPPQGQPTPPPSPTPDPDDPDDDGTMPASGTPAPGPPPGGGDDSRDDDSGSHGTGGGRLRVRPGTFRGVPGMGYLGSGDIRLVIPGSGVIDPLETALGRITVSLATEVGVDPGTLSYDDGDGGGAPEPGTGGTASTTLSTARPVRIRLQRFVPRFEVDPHPESPGRTG